MNKRLLRNDILKKRCMMAVEEVNDKSLRIIDRIVGLGCFKECESIMCYMSIRNEVNMELFIEKCILSGKKVSIPLVDREPGNKGQLIAFEIKNAAKDTIRGTYDILEPDRQKCVEVKANEIDMVVVPGLAFDMYGYRIGYGAGYYDMFLKEVRADCIKLGAAYEMQLVEQIDKEAHDVPVDILVTENRLVKCLQNST
jgi:5-formyltetrahydrofolate cyclo-ligase